ncbi:MAG: CoA transferase [Flavobacteriia bacterium]|nr:CoA transferase [Flavobacteriia bacterium]
MKLFSNLKVIDVSTVLAGPSVATFFAELGAEVLKIENKKNPDVTRSWKLPAEDINSTISAYFSSINYHKKYLSLDFKDSDDYQTFLKLIQTADVLISNFKFGDEEKLMLTDSILRSINPKLIIGKINGFGEESDRVAYDLILQAETGFMSMNGTSESGPVKMPVALIDVLAAHHLKEGLLLALMQLEKKKEVKTVSVSLYDAAVSSLVNQASNFLMNKHIPKRIGSLHPNIAPYGEIFTTKNKELITFAIGSNVHFSKLCSFLKLNHLINDSKFSTNQNRVINRIELEKWMQFKIQEFTSDEILETMLSENVPVGKIKDLEEVFMSSRVQNSILTEEIEGVNTKRLSTLAFKWK